MRNPLVQAAALALAWPSICFAQNVASPPDPQTVVVPDLSRSSDPEVVANGWKYFFFQKNGVSYAEAYDDLNDCYRFLQPNSWASVKLNRFVPWNDKPGRKVDYIPNPYGLVGDLLGAMVEGTMARRDLQAKMRRCMEPRGYTRYGVAEEVWETVTKRPTEQSIAIQAKIASSPSFGGKVPVK